MTPIEISSLIVKRAVMKLLYLISFKACACVDICFFLTFRLVIVMGHHIPFKFRIKSFKILMVDLIKTFDIMMKYKFV